ncbi:MAG: hypothetical protein JSU77_02175 [Fidelibacterota bacterium]|nr:MAG: hypothetical protein JSU77_02175 [Candidatus Neomarinimicrobiota bacterium]
MLKSNINRTLLYVAVLIALVNAIISIANVIEDGAIARRIIPAVCWSLGAIFWSVPLFRKSRKGSNTADE